MSNFGYKYIGILGAETFVIASGISTRETEKDDNDNCDSTSCISGTVQIFSI